MRIFLSLIFLISTILSYSQPQNSEDYNLIDSLNTENTIIFKADFPQIIASDSLVFNGFSELIDLAYYNPYYNFPHDSIRTYSDSVYYERIERLNKKSPIALTYNESVRAMIDLYIRKNGIISRALSRKDLYFPMYEEMLDKYNIPQELKYLSIIESALNPVATSRARAVGLWQFMSATGRMYGLHSSYSTDDRMDPYKSTEAACQHLSDLYDIYGDWFLVLAAYNAGPGNVNKAMRRSGKTDYWGIRPYLPRETQSYVPAFIAVNYMMKYSASHNIQTFEKGVSYYDIDTVKIYSKIKFSDLASWLNIPQSTIELLNPQYTRKYIPKSEDGNILCLPVDIIGDFILNQKLILSGISRQEYEQQAMGE